MVLKSILICGFFLGHLGELTLSIPWSNLKTKPVQVYIKDVYVLAVPRNESTVSIINGEAMVPASKITDRCVDYSRRGNTKSAAKKTGEACKRRAHWKLELYGKEIIY